MARPTKEYAFKVRPKRALLTGRPGQILKTHDSLQRLVQKVANETPSTGRTEVAFELSKVSDIDPGGMLLMMSTAYVLSTKGWRPYASDPTEQSLAMKRVHKDLAYLKLSPEDRINFPRDVGEYPLRAVFDHHTMVKELEDWSATVKHGTTASDEVVARWSGQISEVVTNSFQHGPQKHGDDLPPVYLAGGLRDGEIQLAVLDRGRGIPVSIEPSAPPSIKSHHGKLIGYACQRGVSSHSTRQNQGAGLPDLIESVKNNNGTLQIFSHRGYVHLHKGILRRFSLQKSDRSIAGTLTIVSLRI